ncbi:MAG: hypothetical protein JWQ36_100 [Enterovirga sp.]|nr:hypothetical protein [Enterovirga sp.]
METRRLGYFMRIVECGSISRAAAHLKVAQPALSQQLAILEREMQAQLLTRSAKGVAPTEAGLALYRHGRILLRRLDHAHAEVLALAGASGVPVSVGLPLSTASLLAMPLLQAVRARHAGIRLRLYEDLSANLATMIRDDRLDLAVLFENEETADLRMETLWIEELFLIVPGHSPLPDPVRLEDLSSFAMVIPSPKNGSRLVLEAALTRLQRQPHIVAELNSIQTLTAAVANGIGYTVLPWTAVHDDVLTGALRVLTVEDGDMIRHVSLCRARNAPATPAMEAVAGILRELSLAQALEGRSRGMTRPNVRTDTCGTRQKS